MRGIILGLVVLAFTGCGPEQKRVEADKVVAKSASPTTTWPLLLRHCQRTLKCDPTSNFGQGVGQASGVAGAADWFAETREVVKEGGQDYGDAIIINLRGEGGQGGPAGSPLTIDEAPDSLKGKEAQRSTLSIEYRTPGGHAPELYWMAFSSAHLKVTLPGAAPKSSEEMINRTSEYLSSLHWAQGEDGLKIEIAGKAGVLFTGYSIGLPAGDDYSETAIKRGFEPFLFYAPRNLRDEPLPALIAALEAGETLSLKISAPSGGVLSTAIYTVGYKDALAQATAALADPEIVKPIEERCARFAKEADSFWKMADVTPALRVCDARTPEQRRRDGQ